MARDPQQSTRNTEGGSIGMSQELTRSPLKLLYEINRELTRTIELKTVIERVLSLSCHYLRAERGTLVIFDEHQEPVEGAIMFHQQMVPDALERLQTTVEQGLAGWVKNHRQGVLITDTSRDSRWLRRPDDAADHSGSKSAICVPLQSRDRLVGVLTVVHPEVGFFNLEHQTLLQTIANQATIAVYNAQLFTSLQAATHRYRELFEDSIDPILITDWDGRIVEANSQAARMSGFSREQLAQVSIFELHSTNNNRLGDNQVNLESGETHSYESRLKTRDGSAFPVMVYVRKVNFSGKNQLQWILHDLSERKALDSLREDLSAMIYHDLRSPLANIISSLDMLQALLPPDSMNSVISVFNIANRSTDRMQRLINSLLDINRLESGQPITNQKSVPIKDIAYEAIETIQPIFESKQQTLLAELPDDLPAVWVDEDMIRRVLINLLENAIKFTPINGEMSLGGRMDGDSVYIWIQDSGPGIPVESQEKIFEKFTRLQPERFPKGLGLGLAFCRLAVQAHGGRIKVESKVGEGSRFIINLPVAKPD